MENTQLKWAIYGFIVATLFFTVGYFIFIKQNNEVGTRIENTAPSSMAQEESTFSLSNEKKYICQGYKHTYLREDRNFQSYEVNDVIAEAGTPTDRATIVVNEQDGYIGLLTAGSVAVGTTEPVRYKQFYKSSPNYLVGWEQEGTRVETLLFDTEQGVGVWSKVGNFGPVLGTSAQAIYFVCATI